MTSNFDYLMDEYYDNSEIEIKNITKKIYDNLLLVETYAYLDVFESIKNIKATIEIAIDFLIYKGLINCKIDDNLSDKIKNQQFHLLFGTSTIFKLSKLIDFQDKTSLLKVFQYLSEFIVRYENVISNRPLKFNFNSDILFNKAKDKFNSYDNFTELTTLLDIENRDRVCYFDDDIYNIINSKIEINNFIVLKFQERKIGSVIISFKCNDFDFYAISFYDSSFCLKWFVVNKVFNYSALEINRVDFKSIRIDEIDSYINESNRFLIESQSISIFYNIDRIYKAFQYKINDLKFRFFHAPAIYSTWPKLFVLSARGKLYSEYLFYYEPHIIDLNVDFFHFKPTDYQFGGYQHLEEVTYDYAVNLELKEQDNWIEKFLNKKIMGSHSRDENFYRYFDPQHRYNEIQKVEPKKSQLKELKEYIVNNGKIRFFYAEEIKNTWPKLFILTEEGKFYCEYLDFLKLKIIDEKFDFINFKSSDYSFKNYQKILEISKEEALQIKLREQENWVVKLFN